jgi:formate-nitrite transporter family protein
MSSPGHSHTPQPAELEKSPARERREIQDRSSPSALIIHEAIRLEGQEELERPVSSLAWSGLAAGLSMGLSLVGKGVLEAQLPPAIGGRELITNFGYALGFLVVVLGRQQLYTENTLTAVVPTLYERTLESVRKLLRLWSIVFAANVAGTLLFALTAATTDMFPAEARHAFHDIGMKAAEPDFAETLMRAIPAGWIIALMVWLQPASGSARAFVVLVLAYFVGVGELAHVIAGSAEVA